MPQPPQTPELPFPLLQLLQEPLLHEPLLQEPLLHEPSLQEPLLQPPPPQDPLKQPPPELPQLPLAQPPLSQLPRVLWCKQPVVPVNRQANDPIKSQRFIAESFPACAMAGAGFSCFLLVRVQTCLPIGPLRVQSHLNLFSARHRGPYRQSTQPDQSE